MTIFLKKLPFDTATQTRNTERAFPFREGSFAAQALFFNDMTNCSKLFNFCSFFNRHPKMLDFAAFVIRAKDSNPFTHVARNAG